MEEENIAEEKEEELAEKATEGEVEEDVEGEEAEKEKVLPEADTVSTSRLITTGFRMLIVSFLLISVIYVAATTGLGNLLWGNAADGDLVRFDGKVVGSKIIGQNFTSEKYFHPRPSSKGYDGMDSGSANLAPTNDKITVRAKDILDDLKKQGIEPKDVPVSFVTESGSSLDPHIRPQSAYLQVPRVSKATGIPENELRQIIEDLTQGKFLGLYGQKRVNVLMLNLKVKELSRSNSDE